jgi:hypothetical protein
MTWDVTTLTPSAMLTNFNAIIDEGHSTSRTIAMFSAYLRRHLVPTSVTPDERARQESSQRMRREMEEATFRREVEARVKVEVEAALSRQNCSTHPNRSTRSNRIRPSIPLQDEGSYFGPPRNTHQSFYAGTHSADGGSHSACTDLHSARTDAPSAGTGVHPVQQIDPIFTTPFYISHEDAGFQEQYPHANLEEYQNREVEEESVQDEREVIPDAPRCSARPTDRTPSLPSGPPSIPAFGAVNVPLITSLLPGVSPCVEQWGMGPQVEDATEEAEVKNNAEIIPKPELNTEVPVVEQEQRNDVLVVEKGESAIIVGETVISEAEPESNGEPTDKTEANGNIQHDFIPELEPPVPITGVNGESQETNGEMETPEDTQNTSQGNSIFTVSQVNDTQLTHDSTYASQEEVCDLTDRMDDVPRYRAPRQLRGSSPLIADEDAPCYELRSAARQQRQSSPLVANNAVLGKRSRPSDDGEEDEPEPTTRKHMPWTPAAEATGNRLAAQGVAGLEATRAMAAAVAESARIFSDN